MDRDWDEGAGVQEDFQTLSLLPPAASPAAQVGKRTLALVQSASWKRRVLQAQTYGGKYGRCSL